METKTLVLAAIVIAVVVFAGAYYLTVSLSAAEQEGYETEIIAENLDTPWALDFLPNGKIIFTERSGTLSILDENTRTVIARLPVTEVSESGLLGVAVDPGYEQNNHVYVYYSYKQADMLYNKVVRFTLKNNILSQETTLLDKIPGARFHDGGRIKFGPDGKLYTTTGDITSPSLAQDLNSLAGKILRINKDGTIPEDNPFGSPVYSYGHRNPQGIAWHPITGEIFSSEHGPSKNDEINIILKGGNYGWPTECTQTGQHINPLRCYTEFTLAPSGIAFQGNDLYVASLKGSHLRRLVLGGDNKTIVAEEELFTGLGRIREAVEHDGYIYIATSNRDGRGVPRINDDKIIKIRKQ